MMSRLVPMIGSAFMREGCCAVGELVSSAVTRGVHNNTGQKKTTAKTTQQVMDEVKTNSLEDHTFSTWGSSHAQTAILSTSSTRGKGCRRFLVSQF